MKKTLLLFYFVLQCCCVFADDFEKNYGNGVVHIQADSISSLEIYSAPDSEATHHIYITRNAWSLGRTMITFDKLIDSFPAWFTAEYFITDGEYARIDITAIDSTGDFYRTTLSDDSGRPVFIRKHKHVKFLSWLEFYSTVASIELISEELILFASPSDKSKSTNYTKIMNKDERSYMRALEVQGMWMKVELQIPVNDPAKPWIEKTGWIRWRNEKHPLIAYNLMGC